MRKIIQAKETGYKVELHLADIPPEVAARRAYVCGQEGMVDGERQIVNPEFVLGLGQDPTNAFNQVIKEMPWLVDNWPHWNMNVPQGEHPVLVGQK